MIVVKSGQYQAEIEKDRLEAVCSRLPSLPDSILVLPEYSQEVFDNFIAFVRKAGYSISTYTFYGLRALAISLGIDDLVSECDDFRESINPLDISLAKLLNRRATKRSVTKVLGVVARDFSRFIANGDALRAPTAVLVEIARHRELQDDDGVRRFLRQHIPHDSKDGFSVREEIAQLSSEARVGQVRDLLIDLQSEVADVQRRLASSEFRDQIGDLEDAVEDVAFNLSKLRGPRRRGR